MPIIDNWKKVLILSISFWAQVAGVLVLIVPELVFVYTGIDTDPNLLWRIAILLLIFGLGGRLIEQERPVWVEWLRILAVFFIIALLAMLPISPAVASDRETKTLDIAAPLIASWEGLSLDAYSDIVGVPTICYGSTRGVEIGMSLTQYQCDQLLRAEVAEYRCGWLNYVAPEAYEEWLPATRDAAYTSLAYNVGIRAAGRSTATRRLNSGDIVGGCQAIGWWNRAGGRVIRGLVNRRQDETNLCLKGI